MFYRINNNNRYYIINGTIFLCVRLYKFFIPKLHGYTVERLQRKKIAFPPSNPARNTFFTTPLENPAGHCMNYFHTQEELSLKSNTLCRGTLSGGHLRKSVRIHANLPAICRWDREINPPRRPLWPPFNMAAAR